MATGFNANKAFRAVFLGNPYLINRSNMKDDLILGRTIHDRVFDLVVEDGKQKRFTVGWWVTSKNYLLKNADKAGKIIKFLNKVSDKKVDMVTALNELLGYGLVWFLDNTKENELPKEWIIDSGTKSQIVTVMLDNGKRMHWMDGFISRCKDFANGAKIRRKKKYEVPGEATGEFLVGTYPVVTSVTPFGDPDGKKDETTDGKPDGKKDETTDGKPDGKKDENPDGKKDENPDGKKDDK